MDWITHIASAVAGALMALLPVGFWAWRQKNSIQAQQIREAYEYEKLRRSDAYQELTKAADEGRKDRDSLRAAIDAQSKQIAELQTKEIECQKKTATLEVENYKQASIINFLESRVKALESMIGPQVPATQPSVQGAILSTAVKDIAKEAITEAAANKPTVPK